MRIRNLLPTFNTSVITCLAETGFYDFGFNSGNININRLYTPTVAGRLDIIDIEN